MLKVINRIFGAIVLLLVLIIGGLFLLPADRIARVAADQIKNATGRDVTISGDVSMTIWPVLGASVGELEIGNAEWSEQGPMITAQNAALGLDAMSLLRGEFRITNIEAQSPTIRLDSRVDGRASWKFSDASGTAEIETTPDPDREPGSFSIQALEVTDATLIYDAEGADLISYSGVDLKLDWPEANGEARIDAVLRPAGVPVVIGATIDSFASFLAGDVRQINVDLQAAGGQVTLAGRAGIAGDVAGAFTLKTDSTDGFLKALGLPGADLPQGLGASIDLSTELTLTSDRNLSLRDLVADLDGNRITGAADIGLNGVPQINAQLDAGALDLASATGGSGDGTAAPAGSGWSKTAIDASGLAAFNGDIALRADSVDLGTLKFGATRTLLRNERSRMVFELREVAAYNGTLSGEFVLNNRSGVSVGGKLFGQKLALEGLLGDLAGITRLTGAADAEIQFLGVGASTDAIMRSLSGKGALRVGTGTIRGFNLDQLMRSGQGSGGTTVFDSLGATFAMKNGELSNNDLLVALENYEARGKGVVGLGTQTIDYLFTPKALRANDGNGIAIPVRIRGPWANPKIVPDLEAVVDLNFSEEKERIERKAKEEVERAVEKELGVTPEEGQSVGEALEKKLEDEVSKRLKRLFD
ncbi:MAG: AsmA family protein [Aliishimia sp.]